MKLTLGIWRQVHAGARGAFVRYELDELGEDLPRSVASGGAPAS